MKAGRRLARSLAFLTLFELESRPDSVLKDALDRRRQALTEETGENLDESSIRFATALVKSALQHRDEIDARVHRTAPAFPIEQMPVTDRVALELALCELLFERRVPVRVAINEAVELAKTYGGENSGRFVNGVLGTIAEGLEDSTSPPARRAE
jgi:N utilization substance protein B